MIALGISAGVWVTVFAISVDAAAASFDCKKAAAAVEKMICGDAQLSAIDGRLARAYRRTLEGPSDPTPLKAAQRSWLATERSKCADVACLEEAYQRRLTAIESGASKDLAYSFTQPPFVSPRIVDELSTSIADEGDLIIAINLTDAQGSNRYSAEIEVVKQSGQTPYVRYREKGENPGDAGTEFGYEYVGRTASGIDVLRTRESSGGTGVFENLMLVRLEHEAGGASLDSTGKGKTEVMTFKKRRTLLRKVGEIGLGDRWEGKLKITGNEISIGRDVGFLSDKGGTPSRLVKVEFQP
jgi:uncharacterized protein